MCVIGGDLMESSLTLQHYTVVKLEDEDGMNACLCSSCDPTVDWSRGAAPLV